MADYINPEAIRPKYGWQPQGALAGMWSMRDRFRYDDVASLQDLLMRLQAQKEREELIQGAPVRAAERQQKISAAQLADLVSQASIRMPGYGEAKARGTMGEAGIQEAAGDIAMRTRDEQIKQKNLEAIILQIKNKILQDRFNTSTNPWETLIQSPEHVRDMTKEREQIAGREKVARIGAGATIGAANIAANAPSKQKENYQQRRNAVLSQLAKARTLDDLGENGHGLLGEGVGFINDVVIKHPAVQGFKESIALGNISQEQMPVVQENMRKILEQAWDVQTSQMPLLQQANPYKAIKQPTLPSLPKGGKTEVKPGVYRLD